MENSSTTILDVTKIEPRLKHPTIFAHFDALKPGEGFILHNDHDPKPLYYQLLNERGDIFNWEYLEKGPEWYKIHISIKKALEQEESIGEMAANDPRKVQVFKKYGLDFCCGGHLSLREACEEKGLDPVKIEKELQQADQFQATRPLPFNEWSIDFLTDYIVNTHHSYVRKSLPDLLTYAEKVFKVHGDRHPELNAVDDLVNEIAEELLSHMVKEENVLFPFIKELVSAKNTHKPYHRPGFSTIANPIRMMEVEHETVGKKMEEIRHLTHHFSLPEDACASYELLYRMLEEFEDDLHQHIHLENNILFPKALALEKELGQA
ncbi:hypothetical protein MASR2M12_05970 [Bacteroidales bacterium]